MLLRRKKVSIESISFVVFLCYFSAILIKGTIRCSGILFFEFLSGCFTFKLFDLVVCFTGSV
jgi:hypothetical protein